MIEKDIIITSHCLKVDGDGLSKLFLLLARSLYYGLCRFRRKAESRILWADVVCIDQEKDSEKSYQVNMMDAFYSQANNVLVWLGDVDDSVPSTAFRYIRDMSLQMEANASLCTGEARSGPWTFLGASSALIT